LAYKGVIDDFKAAIELRKPSRVPVVANSEEFDVHVCGGGMKYSDYNSNAKNMASVQIAAIKRFDYDWAWLQVDDCIVYEILGVEVRGEGDILPATCGYLPATRETLDSLPSIDFKKDGRMPVLMEALKRIKEELGDDVVVVGNAGAPFSAVALTYGIEETMLLPLTDPELLLDTLKYFVDIQTAFGLAQKEAGADAIWFGDCNASGHLMSEQYYAEYAVPYAAQVVKEYGKAGLWTFYHASEEKIGHLKLSTEVGMSLLSTGPGLDIAESKAAVGSKMGIIGNLDPIGILMNGTPDQVDAEARRIMRIGKQNGGYVFCTGEMNPRDVPVENMEAMLRAAREESYY
jgi:MtaA/CmuA family methyltransferase